jgi:hypothetical protein
MRKTTFGILMIALAVSAGAALAQEPAKGWLTRATAQDYRERARYPESSRALMAGEKDPVREKRAATRQTSHGPNDPEGKGAALSVWAGSVSYEVGRPITLFATVEAGLALEVSADVMGETGDP